MKHTPGPWRFANGDRFDDDFLEPSEYQYLVLAGKETPCAIASFWDCEWGDEAKANARLIAAAPDLLEAAVQASGVLAYCLAHGYIDSMATAEAKKAMAGLDAAIAKATGAD